MKTACRMNVVSEECASHCVTLMISVNVVISVKEEFVLPVAVVMLNVHLIKPVLITSAEIRANPELLAVPVLPAKSSITRHNVAVQLDLLETHWFLVELLLKDAMEIPAVMALNAKVDIVFLTVDRMVIVHVVSLANVDNAVASVQLMTTALKDKYVRTGNVLWAAELMPTASLKLLASTDCVPIHAVRDPHPVESMLSVE